MGDIIVDGGIAYSVDSQVAIFNLAGAGRMNPVVEFTNVLPFDTLVTMPWALWGDNNLMPQEMADDIEKCGILDSIIDAKSRFTMGEGMVPVITGIDEKTGRKFIKKYVDDAEINDFMEFNNLYFQQHAMIKDLLGLGNSPGRLKLSRDRKKVERIRRDDVTEIRCAKKNSKGVITHLYHSAEWQRVKSDTDSLVFKKPLLKSDYMLDDFQSKVKNMPKETEFSWLLRYHAWNRHYYSMPLWYAAYKWVKIAQGIPEMKAKLFENSIRIKYLVVIHQGFWEKRFGGDWSTLPEEKQKENQKKVFREIDDYLVGVKNSFKAIFTTGYMDREGNRWQDVEIKAIKDETQQGELLPDSAAANSEISFAMLWNPSIFGGNQKNGLYSENQGGSNVREATLVQVILYELERRMVTGPMNVIKRFNGWTKRHPGLDFVIPATILTTLDTGAGSKPVTLGNAKPKEDGTN